MKKKAPKNKYLPALFVILALEFVVAASLSYYKAERLFPGRCYELKMTEGEIDVKIIRIKEFGVTFSIFGGYAGNLGDREFYLSAEYFKQMGRRIDCEPFSK